MCDVVSHHNQVITTTMVSDARESQARYLVESGRSKVLEQAKFFLFNYISLAYTLRVLDSRFDSLTCH